MTLPTDSKDRKNIPIVRGLLDYFPAACSEVARLSMEANDKHNPGEEMHHGRGKSADHADCIGRHLIDRGNYDDDGFLHEVKVAWRALALLQEALEAQGAPLARGARVEKTYSLEEATAFFAGYDFAYKPCPSRIAGDSDTALRIKNKYYHHDPEEVIHECDCCGDDIVANDGAIYHGESVYCCLSCATPVE